MDFRRLFSWFLQLIKIGCLEVFSPTYCIDFYPKFYEKESLPLLIFTCFPGVSFKPFSRSPTIRPQDPRRDGEWPQYGRNGDPRGVIVKSMDWEHRQCVLWNIVSVEKNKIAQIQAVGLSRNFLWRGDVQQARPNDKVYELEGSLLCLPAIYDSCTGI